MIIPRPGDTWEFRIPGKRKKCKTIWYIGREYKWEKGRFVRRPMIMWKRHPKGRYTGIRPRVLLKYGKRISTKAERDARFEQLVQRS